MKILVIGGTYFLGKAFLDICDDGRNEVLLVNRGSREPKGRSEKVESFRMDRHDAEKRKILAQMLQEKQVEVVVDFCAYDPGDIKDMMTILTESVVQYVFISTCDVYERGSKKTLDESAPLEVRSFGGQEGKYVSGKIALEKELQEQATKKGVWYTSLRPVIIYGPGNYAPREGIFFHWIAKAGQILYPEDADGRFQMVYVKDVARCIYDSCFKEDCYDRAINVCGETCDYRQFANALDKACGREIERVSLTVRDIWDKGIPMPFPLVKEESEIYEGDFLKKQGFEFTPLEAGLRESMEDYLRSQEA